tara:strand:- start:1207 stop:1857 length:651 start_codon:yes stop_codon:yes gene_type:complete
MKPQHHSIFLISALLAVASAVPNAALAQQTNNASNLTNQAAPSASANTTGGTNINYQTNNTYQNEVGFGPGVFCRTPTLYIGGNAGRNQLDAFDAVTESGNVANNYAVNAGIVYPFGSSAIEACKTLANTISRDREISTQLSMIKACADLEVKGIQVDPEIFPLLKACENPVLKKNIAKSTQGAKNRRKPEPNQSRIIPPSRKINVPAKIPQTTKS